jgi:hypothetical protein
MSKSEERVTIILTKLAALTAVTVLLASSIAAAAPRVQNEGDDETQLTLRTYSADPDQRSDHLVERVRSE